MYQFAFWGFLQMSGDAEYQWQCAVRFSTCVVHAFIPQEDQPVSETG
jgi:hypothetical protein